MSVAMRLEDAISITPYIRSVSGGCAGIGNRREDKRLEDDISITPYIRSDSGGCAGIGNQREDKHLEDATSLLITQEEVGSRVDTPFRKQSFILLAEGVYTMMFLLVHDVVTNHFLVALAIGEGGIAITPT